MKRFSQYLTSLSLWALPAVTLWAAVDNWQAPDRYLLLMLFAVTAIARLWTRVGRLSVDYEGLLHFEGSDVLDVPFEEVLVVLSPKGAFFTEATVLLRRRWLFPVLVAPVDDLDIEWWAENGLPALGRPRRHREPDEATNEFFRRD